MTRYLVTENDGHCYGFATAAAAITQAGPCATIVATDDNGTSARPLRDEEAVTRSTRFQHGNRYAYDFTLCKNPRECEWAQIDTGSDASYFGQWCNPFLRAIIIYAEGDETTIKCCDDQRFLAELRKLATWHHEHDQWKGVDAWNSRLVNRFFAIGAGGLLRTARPSPPLDDAKRSDIIEA